MGQTNFLQSLGWAILNSLWQLAFLWILFQVIIAISRKTNSSFKSTLASTLLISGFGWFVYTFLSVYLKKSEAVSINSSVFVNPAANETVNEWLQKTLPAASIVYLVLLIFPVLHFIRNYRYVQVIRKFGLGKIDVSWRMFVSRVSAQMNIRKKVHIWVSEFVSSPVTIGFLKPIILVPIAAINHLTPQQLEAILLHELSHIRRYDYLINLIINVIQSVLYFNPFVKAFVKIIEREREKSCDEMVLQFQYNAHDYATALLTLEQTNRASKPLAMAASGKKNDLLHRVEMILGISSKKAFSFQKLAGLMAGFLCIIAFQTLLLLMNQTNGKSIAAVPKNASISLIAGIHSNYNSSRTNSSEKFASVRNQASGKQIKLAEPFASAYEPVNSDYIQASFDFASAMELTSQQEEQVELAMEASKKILENVQWKLFEKKIGEVFSENEKEVLKEKYQKQVKKMVDNSKWDEKIRLAYNKIDWDKFNAQLDSQVAEITKDSIQTVYSKALTKLDNVKKELTDKNLKGIPDSDISLQELEVKKTELKKAINDLKTTKVKKIVRI